MGQAFEGGVSSIVFSQDVSAVGEKKGTQVELSLNDDLVSFDFSEDMFGTTISGSLIVTDSSGWIGKLGGLLGTEWITVTFDSQEYSYDDSGRLRETKPYTITHSFKIYKVTSATSESNNMVTYGINFTSYQYLIDSVKFEKHLNVKHIGPIATNSSEQTGGSLVDQDYGLVNKIFDSAGFEYDISTSATQTNVPILDVEETHNWVNFIPSYLDNRNTDSVLDQDYGWNNFIPGQSQKDSRPKSIFELLNELAVNSVAKENKNAANYLCWGDLRGWHFRSIDSYLRKENIGRLDRSYTHSITNAASPIRGETTRIVDLEVLKQVDYMDLINKQALSSEVIYYELNPDNEYAAYYLNLPTGMQGLQKVIGPSGLSDSIGRTIIDTQAVIQSGLSYDYLLDYNKWSRVEEYPILPDKNNLYTQYTDPSFLEIPPQFLHEGIGNTSWLGSQPMADRSGSSIESNFDQYSGRRQGDFGLLSSFRVANPQEYFRTKFLRQSTLEGSKFRTVHDKIKKPIIDALKDYYNICLQRLFYEHNLIIMSGLNTLESGEGKLGRGPNNQYCEYCVSRSEALSRNWQFYRDQEGGLDTLESFIEDCTDIEGNQDQLCYENRILGVSSHTSSGVTPLLDGMMTCTFKYRDERENMFARGYVPTENGLVPHATRTRTIDLPIIEALNVPLLNEEYRNEEYPRCFSNEPLLPYDGITNVDCVSVREKYLAIPLECSLIKEHLGPEYVSPAIRGMQGDPINLYNGTFWNGYWINPIFNLPNIGDLKKFFGLQGGNVFHTSKFQFFESEIFLKDFFEYDSSGYVAKEGQVVRRYETAAKPRGNFFTQENRSQFDYYGLDNTEQGVADNFITYDLDYGYSDTISMERGCEFGDSGEFGPDRITAGSTRTNTLEITVNYSKNRFYDFIKTCGIPQLCGQYDAEGDTISMPYVSLEKWRYVEADCDGDCCNRKWELIQENISTLNVVFPNYYSNGSPYNYGAIKTLPFATTGYQNNWIDSTYIETLNQFGIGSNLTDAYLDFYDGRDPLVESPISGVELAALRGVLENQGALTAYVPNTNYGLYNGSSPIYNKQDWQSFLECNGTCLGSDEGVEGQLTTLQSVGTDIKNVAGSKAIEYAKYCTYAWNRYWSTPEHQLMYRRAQMSLIQSQEIEITIPCDMNLEIGMLVGIDIPRSPSMSTEPGQISRDSVVNASRGRFLVTGIRRTFTADNKSIMKVRLNRDSLPFNPNLNDNTE